MTSTRTLRLFGACTFAALAACAGSTPSGSNGPGVEIAIAPLTLKGATRVCYHLQVTHGADTVWDEAGLCSDAFGNGAGGGITYVGTCDASGDKLNTVSLQLEDIYALDASNNEAALSDVTDYVNPCPDLSSCQKTVPCTENGDTSVQFNLTMMRNAQQGFFDIAVNFQDIFCSAKFDTCYSTPGEAPGSVTIELPAFPYRAPDGRVIYAEVSYSSFDPTDSKYFPYIYADGAGFAPAVPNASEWHQIFDLAITDVPAADSDTNPSGTLSATLNGNAITLVLVSGSQPTYTGPIKLLSGAGGRHHTGVAALACSAGADTAADGAGNISTQILLTTPTIVCANGAADDTTLTLAVNGLEAGNQLVAIDATHDLHYALYFGTEDLACELGAGSCNKVYYNIAIDLDDLAAAGLTGCTFAMDASATDGSFTGFDGGHTVAGTTSYPVVSYDVDIAAGACTTNPLNGGDGGVGVDYMSSKGFDVHSNGTAATGFTVTIPGPI